MQLLVGIPSGQKNKRFNIGKKWSRNNSNAKDDPYETQVLAYSKELNQLVEANTIISEVEEDDFVVCVDERRTKLDDEEESTMPKTPRPKRCQRRQRTDDTKDKN